MKRRAVLPGRPESSETRTDPFRQLGRDRRRSTRLNIWILERSRFWIGAGELAAFGIQIGVRETRVSRGLSLIVKTCFLRGNFDQLGLLRAPDEIIMMWW